MRGTTTTDDGIVGDKVTDGAGTALAIGCCSLLGCGDGIGSVTATGVCVFSGSVPAVRAGAGTITTGVARAEGVLIWSGCPHPIKTKTHRINQRERTIAHTLLKHLF